VQEGLTKRLSSVRAVSRDRPLSEIMRQRHENLLRRFGDVLLGRRRDQDHLGRAGRHRPGLARLIEIADQDRGVHQGHEVRARAAREGDRLGERKGKVRAGSKPPGRCCS
jgi:hypothetical protein